MKKITIIGGGPAGYAAALYAHNFNLEVTLIESDVLGGTCLNRGCIPAKYWLHVAELNHEISTSENYGINVDGKSIDWNKTSLKRIEIVEKLVSGIKMLLKSKNVNVIEGWGSIENQSSVLVQKSDGTSEKIDSDYIILATGSKPRNLPNIEPDEDGFYHIGDMNLTKVQYQQAYGLVADSGIRGEGSRWKNGSKILKLLKKYIEF